jgi:cell division protein FtsQ
MSATRAGSLSQRLADALRQRARPTPRRPRARVLLAAAAALAVLLIGWFWLRDSSLTAVRTVEVTGVPGPQGARIRSALEEAARSMTTLHVRQDALDTAAAPFSLVKRIEVSTAFPHTMRIHVVTNVAVGAVVLDGRRIAVTSDGTLLRDVTAPAALPEVPLRSPPAGARLEEPAAVAAVSALGAAPGALRSRVEGIVTTPEHGLSIQLAHGPVLWFGSGLRLTAKWAAAAAVLADPDAAGASSIDLSAPERPAVGGLPDGAPADAESDLPELPEGAIGVDPAVDPATDPAAITSP